MLDGSFRRDVIASVSKDADFRTALLRLRDRMRAHVWNAGPHTVNLSAIVRDCDARTREDGFHVLHDWDGKADAVSPDIIPVDVLHYVLELRGGGPIDLGSLAILLDYYFFHLLCLLSLRIWDDGDPDAQSRSARRPAASCCRARTAAVSDSWTMAKPDSDRDLAFRGRRDRIRETAGESATLNPVHQTAIALGHAASMGSHLRFGFEATYGRDTLVMRDDNVADYPWLCFALDVSMREFARLRDAGGTRRQRCGPWWRKS